MPCSTIPMLKITLRFSTMYAMKAKCWGPSLLVNRHNTSSMTAVKSKLITVLEPMYCHDRLINSSAGIIDCHRKVQLHTSAPLHGRDILKKMLTKKKKTQWYETTPRMYPDNQSGLLRPQKKRNEEDNMRVRLLNSVLHKAVTDFLSSYEVDSEIPNYGVDVSKVSLPADFSSCRIYWKTSGNTESDHKIQQALNKCAPRIRYLLVSQQIMGGVPPLVFVKDKQYAAVTEVENLLKIADFGPEDDRRISETIGVRPYSHEPPEEKKTVLFGVDHKALHKQIEEYRQRSNDSLNQTPAAGLTQEQLDTLAEIRRQKAIEKKKKKSIKYKDDDITPKAYLLAKYQEEQDKQDDHDDDKYQTEDTQSKELMAEDYRGQ